MEIQKEWVKYWSDYEMDGGISYILIKSEEDLTTEMIENFLGNKGFFLGNYFSGVPGTAFQGRAIIEISKNKKYAITEQSFGWDI